MVNKKSDHFDGRLFFNPNGVKVPGVKEIFRWKMQGAQKKWPAAVANVKKPLLPREVLAGEVHVTSIGHITHLIQIQNLNILTDPVFSERASPLQWAGPKRVRPPALQISELPPIHLVLVSHNHYDHMDLASLQQINHLHKPRFLVPLENAGFLKSVGIENLQELDWWDVTEELGIKVHCVSAQHWSSRTPFDRNRALWSGFIIESPSLKIYFAGDTGYGPHFQEIAKRCGSPDVSLLPIGAYEPRWFMRGQHMNPEDAVMAHLDLKSRLSIGTHFGTFQLTDEGIDQPVQDLQKALRERGLSFEEFPAPGPGETVFYSK